jgi:hypothetical protein
MAAHLGEGHRTFGNIGVAHWVERTTQMGRDMGVALTEPLMNAAGPQSENA